MSLEQKIILYPLKYSTETALSTSLSSVFSYFTYMIGLTKRSHNAPKMQQVTFRVFWEGNVPLFVMPL